MTRYTWDEYPRQHDPDVPDQPLNPPDPDMWPSHEEYMQHEQDRLIDEAKERDQ